MPSGGRLPAIEGSRLIDLFEKDGWCFKRHGRHGPVLARLDESGVRRYVTIPNKNRPLGKSTLGNILRESGYGRSGLLELIEKY